MVVASEARILVLGGGTAASMLAIPGGEERTADEYRQLLDAAGFRMTRVVPTSCDVSIVEAELK